MLSCTANCSGQFGTLATLFPNRIDLGLGRAPEQINLRQQP
jgi:alkanesulfonate monooxygenase SsuD/methylene tetrahydromethanopterin reductase-like flavin-dependent oxidoreductase (luciferase family)